MNRIINNLKYTYQKYGFLLYQLIARDFKVKYKKSILGIVWSLLYPVLTMAVLAIVFTNVFKFSTPGVNYLVYLMSGLVLFNYFSEASNLAMSSVVANFSLINKVYMPKYIFPLSKCLFVGINFLLTLIPLYAIIFLTGTGVNWHHIMLPYVIACLLLFTIGVGLILATISVFMRDMFYIYGVLISLWTYLTPIMYDIRIIPEKFIFFMKLNPMYWFLRFARDIILFNTTPATNVWVFCGIISVFFLILGLVVFKKNQDKFIYYV